MGMSSKGKKISKDGLEGLDIRKAVENEEKCITRSQIKDEKVSEVHIHHNPHYTPKNKLGKNLAEVFRTDFITAMKIPDSQQLPPGEYVTLTDTWRQEWEKGVQVPVNPDEIKTAVIHESGIKCTAGEKKPYQLPPERIEFNEKKYLECIDRGNTSCNYDLDDIDMEWLKEISSLRTLKKGKQATAIDALTMERALTWFERECFSKMAHAVATKEGLSIEYDESTTCDVCLSPDAEDGNEIIFCDACNMCVHQHCYGILEIPEGNWLCNPCSRGMLSPPCCLCPAKGGAMKRIKDSYEWIHVICAWWVPEVKIEDAKFIERICKDKIPASRWNLLCCICREKSGACIQCSVKRCVKAYHVTCGVKEGLEMKTVVVPDKDDVQHISFCSKHCTPVPPEQNPHRNRSGEEIENNRLIELRKLESEFYSLVSVSKAARELKLPKEVARRLLSYWTMKRRENDNAPLIPLTLEQQEKLSGKQGVVLLNQQKTLEMERFLHLRQDLERLRNLCYMIVRREKLRKELHRSAQEIFYKQNDILLDSEDDLSGDKLDFIRHRSTRFSNFSEHYVTEKDYEKEHGCRLTLFDSTLEEEPLLNNSQLELFDEKGVQHSVVETTTCDADTKMKGIYKNDLVNEAVEPPDTRNIFELFSTKKEEEEKESADETYSSETITKPLDERDGNSDTEKLVDSTQDENPKVDEGHNKTLKQKKQTFINFKPVDKHKQVEDCVLLKTPTKEEDELFESVKSFLGEKQHRNNIERNPKENGHVSKGDNVIISSDSEEVTEISNRDIHGSCISTNRTYSQIDSSPNFKTSSLAKKGKKRFRNLHSMGETQIRRNSPRLHKISESNIMNSDNGRHGEVTVIEDFLAGEDSNLAGRHSSNSVVDQETKRRRLNSCGESLTENEEDSSSSSYMSVRITRSRVSSCS